MSLYRFTSPDEPRSLEHSNLNEKRAGAIAASALPTTKLTNPFEFEEPGGKTKNPQDSYFELKYMTPKTIQMFKIIFNVLPGRLA